MARGQPRYPVIRAVDFQQRDSGSVGTGNGVRGEGRHTLEKFVQALAAGDQAGEGGETRAQVGGVGRKLLWGEPA
jgi:hypothetical protein